MNGGFLFSTPLQPLSTQSPLAAYLRTMGFLLRRRPCFTGPHPPGTRHRRRTRRTSALRIPHPVLLISLGGMFRTVARDRSPSPPRDLEEVTAFPVATINISIKMLRRKKKFRLAPLKRQMDSMVGMVGCVNTIDAENIIQR